MSLRIDSLDKLEGARLALFLDYLTIMLDVSFQDPLKY